MRIFTKRNALVGWVILRIASRKLRGRVERPLGKKRRRGLLLAAGAAVGATAAATAASAVVLHRRRGSRELTPASP